MYKNIKKHSLRIERIVLVGGHAGRMNERFQPLSVCRTISLSLSPFLLSLHPSAKNESVPAAATKGARGSRLRLPRARTKGLRVIALDRPLRKPTSDLPFLSFCRPENVTSHWFPG